MQPLRFAKGQALGNDYLVIEEDELPWPLTPARVRALCDRHRGVGADGILLRRTGERPFRLRIYNPDGGEAEKSGNGLRIFAAYLHGLGLVALDPFDVELATDRVALQVVEERDAELVVSAAMGAADFSAQRAGFTGADGAAVEHELDLGAGLSARIVALSIGNPHAVVFTELLRREDFLARAARIGAHPAFSAGTNVQFARVAAPDRVEAWIYERGAGETLASGSSACAVAAAARRLGLVSARRLTIAMPGGDVVVEEGEEGTLHLTGAAQMIYAGEIAAPVVQSWTRLEATTS